MPAGGTQAAVVNEARLYSMCPVGLSCGTAGGILLRVGDWAHTSEAVCMFVWVHLGNSFTFIFDNSINECCINILSVPLFPLPTPSKK